MTEHIEEGDEVAGPPYFSPSSTTLYRGVVHGFSHNGNPLIRDADRHTWALHRKSVRLIRKRAESSPVGEAKAPESGDYCEATTTAADERGAGLSVRGWYDGECDGHELLKLSQDRYGDAFFVDPSSIRVITRRVACPECSKVGEHKMQCSRRHLSEAPKVTYGEAHCDKCTNRVVAGSTLCREHVASLGKPKPPEPERGDPYKAHRWSEEKIAEATRGHSGAALSRKRFTADDFGRNDLDRPIAPIRGIPARERGAMICMRQLAAPKRHGDGHPASWPSQEGED